MIIKLKGKVEYLGADFLILDVNGVGYKVESAAVFRLAREGATAEIYTYTHVSERELRLFGFGSLAELKLFEKLLSVSGVGPKSAMLLVANHSLRQIITAINQNQPDRIAVKGLGAKTLAKVTIELKGKLEELERMSNLKGETEETMAEGHAASFILETDLSLALTSLGYRPVEFQKVLSRIDTSLPIAAQIKQALLLLNS